MSTWYDAPQGTIAVGLKADLAWTEKKIREIEEGKRSKNGPPSLKYLMELKAAIEEELARPPTYETFRSWKDGQEGRERPSSGADGLDL